MLIADFFSYALKLLDMHPPEFACPELVRLLPLVLLDPTTAEQIEKTGRNTLYERVGGLCVLGHHHPESVWSQPHDHGRTWAIYGVVTGRTAMYDYSKIGDGCGASAEAPSGAFGSKVILTQSYWISSGQAFWFPIGAIHSHKTYGDSKLIRIEGLNLWRKENRPGGKRYRMVTQEEARNANDNVRQHSAQNHRR